MLGNKDKSSLLSLNCKVTKKIIIGMWEREKTRAYDFQPVQILRYNKQLR